MNPSTTTRDAARPATDMRPRAQRKTTQNALPAVHLTRRGRVLLLATLVAVLFGSFSLGRSASEAGSVAQDGPAVQRTTVAPGDSLWTMARRIAPDNDPREVIARIRRLNDLADSQLRPGQLLLLPAVARSG